MSEYWSSLPEAIYYTLLVTALSFAIGAVVALPIMLARISHSRILASLAHVVLTVVRGLPAVVWLFVLFFGISIGAVRLTPIQAAVIGLSIISAAYLAEIYRSGVTGVDIGQFEAAKALGLSPWQAARRVIGPQAFSIAVPGAATVAIGLLKESSLASLIGVTDIVFVTGSAAQSSGAVLVPFAVTGALYITLSVPLAVLARTVDGRLRRRSSR